MRTIETTAYQFGELSEEAQEHEYLNSDEVTKESILANECEFTEDGDLI